MNKKCRDLKSNVEFEVNGLPRNLDKEFAEGKFCVLDFLTDLYEIYPSPCLILLA